MVQHELDQPRGVSGTDGPSASGTWHHIFSDMSALGLPSEVDHVALWIIERFWIHGDRGLRDTEKSTQPLGVRQEPSLDGTDHDAETHQRRHIRQPLSTEPGRAFCLTVEVDENNPGTESRCRVICRQPTNEVTLAAPSIHRPKGRPGGFYESLKYCGISQVFGRPRDNDAAQGRLGAEQGELLGAQRPRLGNDRLGQT